MTIYYVAKNGHDTNRGKETEPFLSINRAAQVAQPGDTVLVHAGTYREWVDPKRGGLDDQHRITYQAVAGEHVILKGSEVVCDWQQVSPGIWKTAVANQVFGTFNPFATLLQGDWLEDGRHCHMGDVFVDGRSLYEAHSLKELQAGQTRSTITDYTTQIKANHPHADWTRYQWYVEVTDQVTTIYVNLHELNPNQALVEISCRQSCFYPHRTGVNYLTLKGFEVCQAATPWAPPTTEQVGMVGPHWAKGWRILDNDLHDAKCSAISLGCPQMVNDNAYSRLRDKPGYQYQLERVFNAQRLGWSSENVGHHLVKGNRIHDCGQGGVIGNLGGIFSEISHNQIFDIGTKYEFGGWEIAGLKFHAPIDMVIEQNHISHCVLGTWLDWEAQGTQVTRNLYHHNLRDLLIEMCHGSLLVSENLFLSKRAIDEYAQGVAFVNNLIAGRNTIQSVLNRATPYHVPHRTAIQGYAMVYGGDDRYYNNLFIQPVDMESGTSCYNDSPTSMAAFVQQIKARMPGDVELFETVRQPVYIDCNVYLQGAQPFADEQTYLAAPDFDADLSLTRQDGQLILTFNLPTALTSVEGRRLTVADLGVTRISQSTFGQSAKTVINAQDYLGAPVTGRMLGPFRDLQPGKNTFRLDERISKN
ncbi:right-handed parallel beta-helix repeat-containing protein [Levilactobacillus namurensis]|uniref:right-handed parallel beta-helix repeat-containing protein n=1 Tax=Levilactobacillus namurensis TaxID=380393 RepID=UPI0004642393|nr:right-handed parallel beta-helix repeat-containing protein [Levilactobacillus namurensis]